MKCALLANGFESRISEKSRLESRLMKNICNRPILWLIIQCSAHEFLRIIKSILIRRVR
jgi:hypothetical protein